MEQRLSQAQLEQVVAEVQQLSQRKQSELDAEEVRDILRELHLPPELLEEAMVHLHRREALAARQQRNRWIVGSVIGLSILLLLGTALFTQNLQRTLALVTVQRDRVTLAQDGGNLSTVSRQANGEVFYRVTLSNAPVGQKLSLSCSWIAPGGQVVHQNRYQTQEITTPVWNTVCRHTIGLAAPVGMWKVRVFLGDRLLSDADFAVE